MITLPFVLFVLAMTGTPGPGNLAMMAIGQSVGYRGALPFLLGTTIGFLVLNVSVAFGLGEVITASPSVSMVLKVLGTAYILYLAAKVLRMQIGSAQGPKSFSLAEGLLVHPTSPKSWAMSVAGFAQFGMPEAGLAGVAVFAGVFFAGQVSCHSLWCLMGGSIVTLLRSRRVQLAVNVCVVALMVGATLYSLTQA